MDLLSFPDTFWNSWDAAWDDEERKPQDELVLPRRTCEASRSHGISFTSADTQLLLNGAWLDLTLCIVIDRS